VDDAADHAPVIDLRLAACIRRQQRRKTPHLRLAEPIEIASPGSPPHS
jgi:hypothetical protein